MIRQNIQNFKLGSLHRTKVTASSGLALLMTFAKDIGLGKQLDLRFSHLKLRQRGYSVSAKILSFLQMIIKGGDRLSDIDLLRADPGLLALLRMEGVPRPNTLADLARRFQRRDIHRLAMMNVKHYSRPTTIIFPDSVSEPFYGSQSLFMNPRQKNIFTI